MMAEAIFYDVVVDIITKLSSAAFAKDRIRRGSSREIEKLKSTMSFLQAVLSDAEKCPSKLDQINELLAQIRGVVYEFDDLVDDISRPPPSSGNWCCFSDPCQVGGGYMLFYRIQDLRSRLDEILRNKNLSPIEAATPIPRTESSISSIPQFLVGREDDKKRVIELIFSNHAVIPIVGIGGQGKTTLAQMVFNDPVVVDWFKPRVWVWVSHPFDVKQIVMKMLESVTRKEQRNLEMNTLKDLLHEEINGKNYLLVLDDFFCSDHEKWSRLMEILMGGAQGSRILITTRNESVADMTRSPFYKLNGLSEDKSWELFKKMAFDCEEIPRESHEKIGKEIVGKCLGVPLVIKSIGRLLYHEESLMEWRSFCDRELGKVDEVFPILKISYDHLPPHLKRCFAYCGLFPKEYLIQVPLLVNLWRAQGFIHHEETGFKYFQDLLSRSLFQEAEEDEWGNLVSCKMHDLYHDLAQQVAGNEFRVASNPASNGIRHLSLYRSNIPDLLPGKSDSLRTLLLLDESRQVRDENPLHWTKFSCKHLRVLDLHSLISGKLPDWIGKLNHLRYLDLSDNKNLKSLPESITGLFYLQVLKLDQCPSLVKLPKGIEKLVNLTHLGLTKCDSLSFMPSGIGKLTSLCSLSKFVLADDSSSKSKAGLMELSGLNGLKGRLDIINLQHIKDDLSECKAAILQEKCRLQNLFLQWDRDGTKDDSSRDRDEQILETLQPNQQLMGINIAGFSGIRFPSWITSLTSLIRVNIHDCRNLLHLPPLYHLPHLKMLKLKNLENLEVVEGKTLSCKVESGSHFFPALENLYLWNCPNLGGWWEEGRFQGSQFRHLSLLTIGHCPRMLSWPLFPPLKAIALWGIDVNTLESMIRRQSTMDHLQYLQIGQITDLKRFPEIILPHLASLKTLAIAECPNLISIDGALRRMRSLEEIWIGDCGSLNIAEDINIDGSGWNGPTRLRSIYLRDLPLMESLPRWMRLNPTLQDVHISGCENLARAPQWLRELNVLRLLNICGCPWLAQRCGSSFGEDWFHVAHISNIKIDGNFVQMESKERVHREGDGSSSASVGLDLWITVPP